MLVLAVAFGADAVLFGAKAEYGSATLTSRPADALTKRFRSAAVMILARADSPEDALAQPSDTLAVTWPRRG
jgi:hypothetical protein